MKDPIMLLHMHKLWGNKKPRAILYNCFEWVVDQKQRDRLRRGLEIDMNSYTTLFSGGACCGSGAGPEPQRAFKVELGRINCVKYSDDNNPLGSTPVQVARGVVEPQRNIGERTQGEMAEMRRTAQQRQNHLCPRFNLSTHYLLQFGGWP